MTAPDGLDNQEINEEIDEPEVSRLFAIYLNDHRAGAAAGTALAERCARSNERTALGRYLTDEFLEQLAYDRALLDRVRTRLDVRDNPFKQWVARAGELIGRTKPNGKVLGYSPLSRILELEALISAVTAKRQLWRVLAALTTHEGNVFEDRIAVADTQREALEAFHRSAVTEEFGSLNAAERPRTDPRRDQP
ncbi:MAG: hypothetical protein H0V67_12235 [Geodermatophilaceae bacterium]|nr:hypothetical protein [Geodermatophilaceae bacterium]